MTTEQTTPSPASAVAEAKKSLVERRRRGSPSPSSCWSSSPSTRAWARSHPRISNPEVDRRATARRAAVRLRPLARSLPDLHDHLDVDPHRCLRGGMAAIRRPPGAVDGHRHDVDRLAGPDHELVAVRGLQPAALALAGGLAAGVTVAHGGTVPGDRVHHVLPRAVLPGHLDPAPDSGTPARRLVRVAPPTDQPGVASYCRSGSSST